MKKFSAPLFPISLVVGIIIAVFLSMASDAPIQAHARVQTHAHTQADEVLGLDEDHQLLHVIDHSSQEAFLDVPPAGDSLGDQFYFNDPVFDETNTKQIGTDQGICARMVLPPHQYECHWSTYLPQGQITVEGPFDFPADSTVAIIGGTGAYKEAVGQMRLHSRDPQGKQYDYFFEIDNE